MGKLPSMPGKKVIKILEKVGYKIIKQKGSHIILKNEKNNMIVVPVHSGEEIGPGLLLKIITQTGLSKDDFLALDK